MTFKEYRHWWLIILVVSIHALAWIGFKDTVYDLYLKIIYSPLRWLYDYILGFSPIPMLYIVLSLAVIRLIRWVWSCVYKSRSTESKREVKRFAINAFHFFATILAFFYLLWGFNYYRPSMSDALKLSDIKPDSTIIFDEFVKITKIVQKERLSFSKDSMLNLIIDPLSLENQIRNLENKLLPTLNIPTPGRIRVRVLKPKGALLIFSTAGIYIPFAMEGHIDAGLHPIVWPFTLAHEMAHGYGITDEGECNFIAMLACIQTTDPLLRYSAILEYWRYLYRRVESCDAQITFDIKEQLDCRVITDLDNIRQYVDRYSDLFPNFSDTLYDSYLKLHGIEDGVNNYSDFIQLIINYRSRYEIPELDLNL